MDFLLIIANEDSDISECYGKVANENICITEEFKGHGRWISKKINLLLPIESGFVGQEEKSKR